MINCVNFKIVRILISSEQREIMYSWAGENAASFQIPSEIPLSL